MPLALLHRPRRAAGAVRRADDDHVTDDERRGIQAELGGFEIDLLIGLELQIDDAVLAERRNGHAGLRVERHHPVAGRHVDDAPIGAVGAGPVGDAAAGAVARRVLAAPALVLRVHPEHFAGDGVQRDGRAPRARGRVQHAVHHQRRRRIQRVGPRARGSRS